MGRDGVNLGVPSTPAGGELRLDGFGRRACGRTRMRFAPRCQFVTCQRPILVGVDGVEFLGEVRRRRGFRARDRTITVRIQAGASAVMAGPVPRAKFLARQGAILVHVQAVERLGEPRMRGRFFARDHSIAILVRRTVAARGYRAIGGRRKGGGS